MGKKITTNPKALEARQRKDEKKRVEQEKKEKEKEDALWLDDDKLLNRKVNRKDEKEKKKQEELEKKKLNKQLLEEELQSIKGAKSVVHKVTKAEIEKNLNAAKLASIKPTSKLNVSSENIIEDNINRAQIEDLVATDIDSALTALSIDNNEKLDKHPEKRMKAAFNSFEEINLPILKKENPTLRLSQLKQMLKKEWLKSPENPINKAFKPYNSK